MTKGRSEEVRSRIWSWLGWSSFPGQLIPDKGDLLVALKQEMTQREGGRGEVDRTKRVKYLEI